MISCPLVIDIEKEMKFEKESEKKQILQYLPRFNLINKGKDDRALSMFLDVAFSRGFARFQALSDYWLDLLYSQRQTFLN